MTQDSYILSIIK